MLLFLCRHSQWMSPSWDIILFVFMIPFYIVCVSALHERKSSGCLSVYAKLPWLSISCCTCAKLCESEHGSHLHCIVCWYILYYLVCIRIVCISNYAGSSAKSRLPSLRLHDSSRARVFCSASLSGRLWLALSLIFYCLCFVRWRRQQRQQQQRW